MITSPIIDKEQKDLIQSNKTELEQKIFDLIKKFEIENGVTVDSIVLIGQTIAIGGDRNYTVRRSIETKISL